MHPFRAFGVGKTLGSLLTLNRRISGNTKRKVNVGEVVKRINRENKYLYGDLIESRGKRRKCLAGTLSQEVSRVDSVPLSEGESEVDCQDANFHPRIQTKLIKCTGVEDRGRDLPFKKSQCFHLGAEVDPSGKPLQREALDILPGVTLRSVKGFPLINHAKKVSVSYSLQQSEIFQSLSKDYSMKRYPSVGKILNATMSDVSKVLLKKWREKMISLLGEEGFLKFYRAQLNAGVQFHAAVESYLRGAPKETLVVDGRGVSGSWESLALVISEVKDVRVLEGPVCHSQLLYHGVMDCVASYQGEDVLIEWKKSDKPKPTLDQTYDAPIQLSAYIGAMNYDQHYPLQVNGGLVVVAYSDGSPASVFRLSLPECNKYWHLWLERLQLFWSLQQESKLSQEIGS